MTKDWNPRSLAGRTAVQAPAGVAISLSADETLFFQGDPARHVFEVTAGLMRQHRYLADGRRQVTGFVAPGHFLGMMPGPVYDNTAAAVTEVTLRRFERAAFERMVDEVPLFTRRLLAAQCQEVRVAHDQMLLLGRKSADERVASFLMSLADQQDGSAIAVPMTRGDVADYLGLTVETVSRVLGRMKGEGMIAVPCSARIEILDRRALRDRASASPG